MRVPYEAETSLYIWDRYLLPLPTNEIRNTWLETVDSDNFNDIQYNTNTPHRNTLAMGEKGRFFKEKAADCASCRQFGVANGYGRLSKRERKKAPYLPNYSFASDETFRFLLIKLESMRKYHYIHRSESGVQVHRYPWTQDGCCQFCLHSSSSALPE